MVDYLQQIATFQPRAGTGSQRPKAKNETTRPPVHNIKDALDASCHACRLIGVNPKVWELRFSDLPGVNVAVYTVTFLSREELGKYVIPEFDSVPPDQPVLGRIAAALNQKLGYRFNGCQVKANGERAVIARFKRATGFCGLLIK